MATSLLVQGQVFAAFAALSPLQVSDYTSQAWLAARAEFNSRMVPLERSIAQQLQQVLRSDILQPLTAAVAICPDRASTAVMQPSQVVTGLLTLCQAFA